MEALLLLSVLFFFGTGRAMVWWCGVHTRCYGHMIGWYTHCLRDAHTSYLTHCPIPRTRNDTRRIQYIHIKKRNRKGKSAQSSSPEHEQARIHNDMVMNCARILFTPYVDRSFSGIIVITITILSNPHTLNLRSYEHDYTRYTLRRRKTIHLHPTQHYKEEKTLKTYLSKSQRHTREKGKHSA